MNDQKEHIKSFTEAFFKSLNCTLAWNGETLHVSNVPPEFESFYGKESPYVLVFKSAAHQPDAELMTRGSYLLHRMAEYMDQRGQATLLKWDFDIDPKELFLNTVRLANGELASFTRKCEYQMLFRFTFATTFQYLNEKEQLMNTLYVHNGAIVPLDIPSGEMKEGKKQDIAIDGTEEAYAYAKDQVRILLEPKTATVKQMLLSRLQCERARILAHYKQQLREYEEEIGRIMNQIADLEAQGRQGIDRKNHEVKLKRLRENLDALQKSNRSEKLKREEEFLLRDEIAKHGLAITNKVINTSIIYYPLYTITLFLKNQDAGRLVETAYDPFTKQLRPLSCETCREALKELWLCTSGHVVCSACMARCPSCTQCACTSCLTKPCEYCSRKSCKKCLIRCLQCNKTACVSHMIKEGLVHGCIQCIKRCPLCTTLISQERMKRCLSCAALLCDACMQRQTLRLNRQRACVRCAQECTLCATTRKKEYFPPCRECKFSNCTHDRICSICRAEIGVKPRQLKQR